MHRSDLVRQDGKIGKIFRPPSSLFSARLIHKFDFLQIYSVKGENTHFQIPTKEIDDWIHDLVAPNDKL